MVPEGGGGGARRGKGRERERESYVDVVLLVLINVEFCNKYLQRWNDVRYVMLLI